MSSGISPKVEAFFREFRFLIDIVRMKDVREAKVSRVDSGILNRKPEISVRWDEPCNEFFGTRTYIRKEQIFLLNRDGKQIGKVGFRFRTSHDNPKAHFWNSKPRRITVDLVDQPKLPPPLPGLLFEESRPDETIGEAIRSMSLEREVYYVVILTPRSEFTEVDVTVLKPPKSFTLVRWVEEQIARAQKEIKADIAEIDSEA